MTQTAQQLLEAVLQLPQDERATIAARILETLPPPEGIWSIDDPGFEEELERRANDPEPGIPWSQLRQGS